MAHPSIPDRSTPDQGAARLAAATPVDRDRYADLLRLFSIGIVVLGHWVVALLTVNGAGEVSTSTPVMLSTWVWQVMALFFFVGGFAHARALRRGPTTGRFVRGRLARLLPPVVVMVAIWAVLAAAVDSVGFTRGDVGRDLAVGMHRITAPLWFLGVYLAIVLAAPVMMRLHGRFGLWRVVAWLTAASAVVDALSLGAGLPLIGYVNMLLVWLAVHQMGFGYADGTLARGGRPVAGALAAGGLAAAVALVFGTSSYPVLMVGLPGNGVSNASPATCALLAQSMFLIGVALLLRPLGVAFAARPTVWLVVATGNSVIMTIFCWHLTACYLVQGVLLLSGTTLPGADTPAWLLALPGWLAACTAACAGLVVVFRRFERVRRPVAAGTGRATVAVLAVAAGLFGLSETGLEGLSLSSWDGLDLRAVLALGLIGLGMLALSGLGRPVAADRDRPGVAA
ncbi:MAG TPA: acyltransferase [Pseudonocardia sp.]|jgi:hypothetical protein